MLNGSWSSNTWSQQVSFTNGALNPVSVSTIRLRASSASSSSPSSAACRPVVPISVSAFLIVSRSLTWARAATACTSLLTS